MVLQSPVGAVVGAGGGWRREGQVVFVAVVVVVVVVVGVVIGRSMSRSTAAAVGRASGGGTNT